MLSNVSRTSSYVMSMGSAFFFSFRLVSNLLRHKRAYLRTDFANEKRGRWGGTTSFFRPYEFAFGNGDGEAYLEFPLLVSPGLHARIPAIASFFWVYIALPPWLRPTYDTTVATAFCSCHASLLTRWVGFLLSSCPRAPLFDLRPISLLSIRGAKSSVGLLVV